MHQLSEPIGHVTFNEQDTQGRFQRFVEDRVQAWIRSHHFADGAAMEYEVAFFDEDSLGEVSCLIVVQAADETWRSWETATEPRQALERSLERMHSDVKH